MDENNPVDYQSMDLFNLIEALTVLWKFGITGIGNKISCDLNEKYSNWLQVFELLATLDGTV